jgi:osmotically-inducible protein OsmY
MKNIVRSLALAATVTLAAGAVAQDSGFRVEEGPMGEGPITVEQRRAPMDARVKAEAIARLRGMQHIEGLIGVEAWQDTVRLTGKVTTAGQAQRAAREVRNVTGVAVVENELRSRVGSTF